MSINLRYYQREAIACALKEKNGILVLPTGSGKSLVIAGICKEIKEPILILQPSKEILEQNFEKIKAFTDEDIGIYSASLGVKEIHRITLATIGSIKDIEKFKHFKVILIDEAHLVRSDAGRYCDLILQIKPTKIIGLTATPYRLKNTRMGSQWRFLHRTRPKIFDKIIYVYQIKKAFEDGFLCPLNYYSQPYDTSRLKVSGNDYDENSVATHNAEVGLHNKVLEVLKENLHLKHFLIFVNTIKEAYLVADKLIGFGFTGYVVEAKTKKADRELILSEFKSGKIKFVVNVSTLTTGFDFPALDCVITIRPTMSLALFYQMMGRGIRIAEGKKSCAIFDLVDNRKTFGDLMTYEIEGEGAQTGLKNSKGWLIKPSFVPVKLEIKQKSGWELPFGKYKGNDIGAVPTNYLEYCRDNFADFKYKNEFNKELLKRKINN